MKTDDLIQKLAGELKPTKPLLSPLKTVLVFALFGFVLIAASFLMMTARPDLKEQLQSPVYLFEISLALLLSISALGYSVYLSRPGHTDTVKFVKKLTFIFLGFVVLFDLFRIIQLSQSQIQLGLNLSGLECFAAVLGFSLVLSAAMIYWLRTGASINPSQSGLVIGTACVALGNVSILFFCSADNGMHTLLWHFVLPMLAALVVTAASSRQFLKW